MGSNTLHPEFGRPPTCTHPNLVLPLLCAIWASSNLTQALFDSLPASQTDQPWQTFAQYVAWLETPMDAPYWTASMYVLAWWGRNYL